MTLTNFEQRELLQALSSTQVLRRMPPGYNKLHIEMLRDKVRICADEKKALPAWVMKSVLPVLELHIDMVRQLQLQAREDGDGLDKPNLYSAMEHAYKLRVRKLRELKNRIYASNK